MLNLIFTLFVRKLVVTKFMSFIFIQDTKLFILLIKWFPCVLFDDCQNTISVCKPLILTANVIYLYHVLNFKWDIRPFVQAHVTVLVANYIVLYETNLPIAPSENIH